MDRLNDHKTFTCRPILKTHFPLSMSHFVLGWFGFMHSGQRWQPVGAVFFLGQNLIGGNLQKTELKSKYSSKSGTEEFGHLSYLQPQQQNVDLNPLSNVNIERLDNHLPRRGHSKKPRETGSWLLNPGPATNESNWPWTCPASLWLQCPSIVSNDKTGLYCLFSPSRP